MKTCFKCGESKPHADFYQHRGMKDGFLGKCKDCAKKDVSLNREKNIDKYRLYDRERANQKHRIAQAQELNRRWRKEDSRRASCHSKVARAVRVGVLVKMPCEVCGSESSMAHHESYDRPLQVVWLCQVHHKARHKEMAMAGIEP